MNYTWISHPQSYLEIQKSIDVLPMDCPIEVGATVDLLLELYGTVDGRDLDDVVSYVSVEAEIIEILGGEFMVEPIAKEFLPSFANMELVNKLGTSFRIKAENIRSIEGSHDWNLKHKKVYCTEKVAAGEKVGFFLDFDLLDDPLVYKKVLFSVTEMEKPKKYKGENRVIIPLSQLVKQDKCSSGFLNYPCPYGAVKYSETEFKFFLEEDIKYLDPKIYMAIPELDFREGAHEEIFNNKDEENDDESECSFPF